MSTRFAFVCLLGCLLVSGCQSAPQPPVQTPPPRKTPTLQQAQAQSDMNRQSAAEAEKADKRMEAVLSELRSHLDEAGLAKLEASQKAWLEYRKLEAESYADHFRGGSSAPMMYSLSLVDSTKRRIEQLQFQLDELKRQ